MLADTAGNLLDPPGLPEIQAALSVLDADALVYLVPGEESRSGWAIIAPVRGAPRYMALPNLIISGETEVERYLAMLAARAGSLSGTDTSTLADRPRDLSGTDPAALADSLAGVCDWAWRAAIGPLLREVRSRPAPAARGVHRIILVPVGDLARIPWQAARCGDGTYAIQLAAFSYAASARMLCKSASQPPVALSAAGLVIGDPDTVGRAAALDAARQEAYCIRRDFYLGARYLGRRPDGSSSPSGTGSADQVRRWLTDPRPAAGTMLHLACHGFFAGEGDPRTIEDTEAYLLLSADDASSAGSELTAGELANVMAATTQRDVGLIVLAACNSGRSIHGYDEAYSLGTACLAGGVRTVVSTQWSIPDAATSSLMYMFHHYLRRDAMPPWQALREAQLWMVEGNRPVPQKMPGLLRPDHSGTARPAVTDWAAFIRWGQ